MGEARCALARRRGPARRRPTAGSSSPRRTDSSGRSGRSAGPSCRRSGIRRPASGMRSTGSSSPKLEANGLCTRRPGRQAHAAPPGDLRPDRPAADARGDRRVPRRRFARGVRQGRRPPARLAALRRAVGAALARRRPLRRRPRPDPVARGERLPRGLALPRLGRRRRSTATCRTPEFVRYQVAGDLLPPPASGGDQRGRAGRHGDARHRGLRARRRRQGPDDRRLRQRPDRRRRPRRSWA